MKSTSSRRQSSSLTLSLATIEQARTALQTLAETPRDHVTVREAIARLESSIHGAFRKGYTRLDIVTLLNQAGIPVSLPSLRYYLGSASSRSADEDVEPSESAPPQAVHPLTKRGTKSPPSLAAALQAPRSPTNRQHVEDVIAYLLEE